MAVAAALARQFAGLYLPFPRKLLHTEPIAGFDLLAVFLASTLGTPRYGWTASCPAASGPQSCPAPRLAQVPDGGVRRGGERIEAEFRGLADR